MDDASPPISDRTPPPGGPGHPVPRGTEPDPGSEQVWLSVEQIRKRERMRRSRVIAAMNAGELPYEQRGRVRYARLCDVIRWQEARLRLGPQATIALRSDLADLV